MNAAPSTQTEVRRAAEREALDRAAISLGGQAPVASACGFADRRHVWPWFNTNRRVPAEHCPAIERATRAAHAADATKEIVTCEELRSDVAWDVLRMQVMPPSVNAGVSAAQQQGA